MPKYIRTKDGIYESGKVSHDDKYVYTYEISPIWCVNQGQKEILKQADTIEELCDEFVILGTRHISLGIPYATCAERNIPITNIRGAIWTDKGLIYVAKMNSNGELELL